MVEQRSRRVVLVALVWLVVAGGAALLYKLVIAPGRAEDELRRTGTPSRFSATVRIAHDSFSGYCLLRSEDLAERMSDRGVRLEFQDDGADYPARLAALRDGEVDLAVFTIDALLKASAAIAEFPATIVLVIDETRGADAVVAFEQGVDDLSDLDHPDARVLLTRDSPSDTLARVLYRSFDISAPIGAWLEETDGIDEVYRRLRQTSPSARRAFVLWEPYVTRALDDPAVRVLVDTSSLKGYIVDVLVASREYLTDNERLVEALIEEYLRAAFDRKVNGTWRELVAEDATRHAQSLTSEQTDRLVAGIHWKNTLENYAHFGILDEGEAHDVVHLEDMVRQISHLLVDTGALTQPPLAGRESYLFYDGLLGRLHESGFHPGQIAFGGAADLGEVDPILEERALPALTDAQWAELLPVGTLRAEPIRFGRGTARLNVSSLRALEALALELESWPYYLLQVEGHSRAEGDPEANRRLAGERAQAAADELLRLGVAAERLRAIAREPDAAGGAAQSVTFEVKQLPY